MSGPEHYVEAQRLLDLADSTDRGRTLRQILYTRNILKAAQVHAQLATAAALAMDTYPAQHRGWEHATGYEHGDVDRGGYTAFITGGEFE